MKKTEHFQALFMRACRVAKKSGMNHRHGAIVLKDGEVVAEGYNHEVPDFKHRFSIHAEMDALYKIKHLGKSFLSQCDMLVVRIGPSSMEHTTKLSMPCPLCRPVIENMGIRRIYYTTNDDFDDAVLERWGMEERAMKILSDRNAAIDRSDRYKSYREDPSYVALAKCLEPRYGRARRHRQQPDNYVFQ